MVSTLKAEFKKLLSVRSTFLITLLALVLTGLFTYLGTSPVYEQEPPQEVSSESSKSTQAPSKPVDNPPPPKLSKNLSNNRLQTNFQDTISAVSLFITIVVILLMAHEFRYNTITYTLTSAKSRSRVLAAKILVGVVFTVVLALLAIIVTVAATYVAVNIKGLNLPPQEIDWLYVGGRLLAYALGFSLFGLGVITLLRNLTAGIVAVFLLPTIDSIAANILAGRNIEPVKFLPFSALGQVGNVGDSGPGPSLPRALIVFAIYLVVLWAVSWYLFLRRDAI